MQTTYDPLDHLRGFVSGKERISMLEVLDDRRVKFPSSIPSHLNTSPKEIRYIADLLNLLGWRQEGRSKSGYWRSETSVPDTQTRSTVVFPTDLWRRLKAFAVKHDQSMSSVLEAAAEYYMDKVDNMGG